MRRAKIQWFARGGGILRSGPYPSQVAAVAAMRTVESTPDLPRYPDDLFVWPEETRWDKLNSLRVTVANL